MGVPMQVVMRWLVLAVILCPMDLFAADNPVRIGATVSLSGRYQATSEMIHNAYRLWATQVNRRGGLLNRPVELILLDDQGEPDNVRAGYRRLIEQEKVDLVLAPYGTPLSLAAAEVTEEHGYTLLASAASGTSLWSKGYRQVFGVYATADRYFIGFLDLIARNDLGSLAILYAEGSFTGSAAEGARIWAGRFGVVVSHYQKFTHVDQVDEFLLQIQPMQNRALIVCAYPNEDYQILQLLAKNGIHPTALAVSIAPALPDFAQKAGQYAEGVFGPSQWEPDERLPFPGTMQFISDFKTAYHISPSYHAGAAFAGCQLLENAVKHTGSLNHQQISQKIRSLDTVTVIGRFKVDKDGRQIGHNPILIQWQNGRKEIVYPFKMKTAHPIIEGTSR